MSAAAQVAELRVGIAEFDERTTPVPSTQFANENSISISAEVLFEEPKFLKWALSPQPYIGGSLNLEGETSFIGGGFLWRQRFFESKFYADYAMGLVVHDGTTIIEPSAELLSIIEQAGEFDNIDDIPPELIASFDAESMAFFDRFDNEIEFGSRALFRLAGAVGYDVTERWAAEIYFEHLSNGDIFSNRANSGREVNDGVNLFGVRAARKF